MGEFNLSNKLKRFISNNKTSWKYLKRKGYIDAEQDGDCIFVNCYGCNSKEKLEGILKEFIQRLKESYNKK